MRERIYPDEPAGPFPTPPRTITDRTGRDIDIRAYDPADRESVVEMYVAFDPADQAQGIPPSGESQVRSWLEQILTEECVNVLAWHEGRVAGHATLVPDGNGYELAIFVLQDYQEAGIGSELLPSLLGQGAREGVERVWLTVERWNVPAVNLYEKTGFETSDAESFELEMSLRLAQTDSTG